MPYKIRIAHRAAQIDPVAQCGAAASALPQRRAHLEALGLNVGDVYRDRRVQSRAPVRGKGRREGVLFLRRNAERAIEVYLQARGYPPPHAPLFASLDRRTAGVRLSRSSAWRIVHAAAVAAQIQGGWQWRGAAL